MPTKLKTLLYTTAACLVLTGFAFFPEQPVTQAAPAEPPQSAAQRWALNSMAELEPSAVAEANWARGAAGYDACVRGIRADYRDDPARAYGWIRTLCRR